MKCCWIIIEPYNPMIQSDVSKKKSWRNDKVAIRWCINALKSIVICTKKFANLFNDKNKNQRFSVGQTVAFSFHKGWQLGTITQLNYTGSGWDHYVPYQIHFDDCEDEQTTSRLIFAPRDSDTCIRATIPTESEILEDLMTEFQLTYFLNTSNDWLFS